MYRFLLTPRWWGINLFVALAIPVCLSMGTWQLSRFEARVDSHQQQEKAAERAADATPEPLADLLPLTTETVGRTAEATGRYDTGRPLLVPDRRVDGERGFYVLTLLRTDSGPALPVVRGWLPGDADPAKVPAPPGGEVTVAGVLQVSETEGSAGVNPAGGLPEGQLGMISAAALVNVVPYDVRDAWITVQRPEAPLRPVPPVAAAGTGLDLQAFQNLGYTAEWFAFVGFVLFMWFRLFRRDAELARDAALGLPPEDPTGRRTPENAPATGGPASGEPREVGDPGEGVTPEPREAPEDAAGRTRSPSGAA
ncbi:SURF1 family protein [Streptomyces sp. DSM 42041]|uniref:SURF1-like protein n=1 Tax=Streptomyces hazeniae TaxID=3075538 RepID=A0ABU2NW66_9ACTN|nr:SURF1 family protein [Streptomyces sp. DSM 42041]MDT0380237.1 SURF1 family protein [Streptomyces sp. DSM 42041]